jgi:hypothetical protein
MSKSPFKGKYDTAVDPISAFEILQRRLAEGDALPSAGSARRKADMQRSAVGHDR